MTTVNYSWTLPTVGASTNTWGTLLNTILTDIDSKMVTATHIVAERSASRALTNLTGITVVSGGASITGSSSVTGQLTTTDNVGIGRTTNANYRAIIRGIGTTSATKTLVLENSSGTETVIADDAGNVGLGVTPSAWRSGDKVLDMGATTSLVNAQGVNTRLYNNAYVTAGGISTYKTTDFASYYDQGSGVHRWLVAPSGTAGNAISWTQAMTLDDSGNLLVGTTTGSQHTIQKTLTPNAGNVVLDVLGGTNYAFRAYAIGSFSANAANSALRIGTDGGTGRSINAGGTINASGADYAEYERNNGIKFVKGQIVGFKADGTLTDVYADAIRFGVKSTNPGLVGGDTWGSAKRVGERPEVPQFKAPDYQGPQDPGAAPTGPVQQTLADDASDEYKVKASDDFASAHAAWATASADHEKLAYVYRVAQQDHEAQVEIAKHIFDTETYPEYQRALAEFEARLETERQTVDRIAYCGKVPVAVYGATPGGYIIADKDSKGKIIGKFVADPDFGQYKKAVGRVNRVMDEAASAHLVEAINSTDPAQFVGMAEIAVITH